MSRNCKRVWVNGPLVALLIFGRRQGQDKWLVGVIDGLPEDVLIEFMLYDDKSDSMCFLLTHPSFPEVPTWESIPVDTGLNVREVMVEECGKRPMRQFF